MRTFFLLILISLFLLSFFFFCVQSRRRYGLPQIQHFNFILELSILSFLYVHWTVFPFDCFFAIRADSESRFTSLIFILVFSSWYQFIQSSAVGVKSQALWKYWYAGDKVFKIVVINIVAEIGSFSSCNQRASDSNLLTWVAISSPEHSRNYVWSK